MRKILYVILDGLGDRPSPALGGQTPLEAAPTPHLDRLAAEGRQGTVITVGKGVAPESDVAVMAILGYDPLRYHAGRGPLEALGSGLPFKDGDLALRGNFATLGEGWTIVDRRVGRNLTSEEARALAEAVNSELRLRQGPADVTVRATIGHRCAVVFYPREGRLSAKISNTDPAYARMEGLGVAVVNPGREVMECTPLDDSPEAWISAELVNEFTRKSREIMDGHPVNQRRRAEGKPPGNVILVRDAGDHLPRVPSIKDRFGVEIGCFVEMPVERGIARLLGMSIIEVPPSARDRESAYRTWAHRAAEEIRRHGGLYLHLKGPDEPGHDGDCAAKRDVIALIDRAFFGELLPRIDRREVILAVTADHATPCALRGHSADPVPLLIAGPGVQPDATTAFGEREAAKGDLGLLFGVDIMPLLATLARD
ncbi:MAG: alkaline phosphatase family protein [Armatimonadota bacterium]|nr:alkaline phosphatase family protein [Armatimonadota bacterium]MDR7451707.1 alkaline phosphatase family protein [Armatimonadota bacterium]MDR7465675.1 alkaline phosphatase family protein [Armatimonadota bacterium]MDR7493584.1 alkaline phosphatase family protein [Armatimonadota bacterium]MDR7499512.1 alkaline phosphatase family protein [Armatimonadota bacterium]